MSYFAVRRSSVGFRPGRPVAVGDELETMGRMPLAEALSGEIICVAPFYEYSGSLA
jgi:hypothetical protein